MRAITFDIETTDLIPTLGRGDMKDLTLALVGIHDSETGTCSAYLEEDLPKLWPVLERADLLIGFNSDAFDIPLLNRYFPGDLTVIRSVDLMVEVQKSLGRRIRLQSLAEGTLKRGKKGSGKDAAEWWKAGDIERVREYCIEDVRLTRELYEYAREHGVLRYKDLRDVREIKLDTSSWETPVPSPSLTHTLGL